MEDKLVVKILIFGISVVVLCVLEAIIFSARYSLSFNTELVVLRKHQFVYV